MASEVSICNSALQKLGAGRINSLSENSKSARACNSAYERLRDAALRKHTWSFAKARAELAADSDAPEFGYAYKYPLPVDCLRVLPDYPGYIANSPTREIEGRYILTDEGGPLQIRYIVKVTDPNEMDALFQETLACDIALDICEEITQSNTKKTDIREERKTTLAEARRCNAIEREPEQPPEDTWVTVRS
jgi:hypothetical protein